MLMPDRCWLRPLAALYRQGITIRFSVPTPQLRIAELMPARTTRHASHHKFLSLLWYG